MLYFPISSILRQRKARATAFSSVTSTRACSATVPSSGVITSLRPPRFRMVKRDPHSQHLRGNAPAATFA